MFRIGLFMVHQLSCQVAERILREGALQKNSRMVTSEHLTVPDLIKQEQCYRFFVRPSKQMSSQTLGQPQWAAVVE